MKRFYFTLVTVFSTLPSVAFAQGEADFTYQKVVRILFGLVDFLIRIGMVLAVIAIIWYGIQVMTAGGNAEKYRDAKQSVIWAVIGTAIIFGAGALINTIESIIIKQSLVG